MAPKDICARVSDAVEKTCGKNRGKIRRFAELTGLDEKHLSRWVKTVEPGPVPLAAIAKAAGVSLHWLITGEDPEPPPDPATIPTYITGGGDHWVMSEDLDPYATAIPPGLIAYEVRGDSMEPVARNGQVVMANPEAEVDSGDLAVVEFLDGTCTFKRVQFGEAGLVILQPVNSGYDVKLAKQRDIRRMARVWGVKF